MYPLGYHLVTSIYFLLSRGPLWLTFYLSKMFPFLSRATLVTFIGMQILRLCPLKIFPSMTWTTWVTVGLLQEKVRERKTLLVSSLLLIANIAFPIVDLFGHFFVSCRYWLLFCGPLWKPLVSLDIAFLTVYVWINSWLTFNILQILPYLSCTTTLWINL